jgi:hypothetical protein
MTARMHLAHGIAGIALFALLAGCGATGPGQMEAERIDSVEDYIAYHRDLREGLASGMYGEITEHDARIFNEAQGTIFDHVTGIDSLADLSDDARLEVFNAQETINALIRGNMADRMVCRRQHSVGSHRQQVRCSTAQELEDQRRELEHARQFIHPHQSLDDPMGGG